MTGAQQGRFIAPLLALIATRGNKSESMRSNPYAARISAQAQQGATPPQQPRNKAHGPAPRGAKKGTAAGATKPYRVVALVAPSAPMDCWADQVRRALNVFGSDPTPMGPSDGVHAPRGTRDGGVSPAAATLIEEGTNGEAAIEVI